MGRFINYHNVCIRFGTWEERRMNHLPPQCQIMRQTLLNLTFLPHQIKTAIPNWFRHRSFAVLNTSVRFGTWVERRLNRAPVTFYCKKIWWVCHAHISFFSLFIFFHSFFPFLFTCRYLYKDDLIPKGTKFIGYARSDLTVAKLRAKTEPFMKVNQWCWVWFPYRSF